MWIPVRVVYQQIAHGSSLQMEFFFPVDSQELCVESLLLNQQVHATADLICKAGSFDHAAFDEAHFFNSGYMASQTLMVQVQTNT